MSQHSATVRGSKVFCSLRSSTFKTLSCSLPPPAPGRAAGALPPPLPGHDGCIFLRLSPAMTDASRSRALPLQVCEAPTTRLAGPPLGTPTGRAASSVKCALTRLSSWPLMSSRTPRAAMISSASTASSTAGRAGPWAWCRRRARTSPGAVMLGPLVEAGRYALASRRPLRRHSHRCHRRYRPSLLRHLHRPRRPTCLPHPLLSRRRSMCLEAPTRAMFIGICSVTKTGRRSASAAAHPTAKSCPSGASSAALSS